jgi:glutaredoxin
VRHAAAAALALIFATASCTPPQSGGGSEPATSGVETPAAEEAPADEKPAVEPVPERHSRSLRAGASSRTTAPSGYQYIDEAGRVSIAASLEQIPERQRSTATALGGVAPARPRASADEPVGFVQRADVTIYTTPGCGYCRRAMAYFEQKGVEYTKRDISADREAYEDYVNVTGGRSGVPLIVVGDEWMQGWNESHFDQLLAAAN